MIVYRSVDHRGPEDRKDDVLAPAHHINKIIYVPVFFSGFLVLTVYAGRMDHYHTTDKIARCRSGQLPRPVDPGYVHYRIHAKKCLAKKQFILKITVTSFGIKARKYFPIPLTFMMQKQSYTSRKHLSDNVLMLLEMVRKCLP